ncbi:hypothetical protein LPJ81_004619 [Coemansia sp. IMI 209127]|nr:hypothetical protein LPJ81_004619 [Coemansia sp. IMI 209127]
MSKHNQETEADDVGSVPTFFREHLEFFEYLDRITGSARNRDTWTNGGEPPEEEVQLVRKASSILETYQEQPMCLDPHLERIVGQLMGVIQEYTHALYDNSTIASSGSAGINVSRMSNLFDLVYTLCKVRGYKLILRLFPHTVADVEPAFAMLWQHSSVDDVAPSWTTRYILLIWLSLLAMVPFDMDSIDSGLSSLPALDLSTGNGSGRINACADTLMTRWIELGKLHLNKSGCEMEGAAVMLARLLSRRDALEREQPEFISWVTQEISESTGSATGGSSSSKSLGISSVLRINGALRVLCHLFLVMDSPAALYEQLEPLLTIFQSDAFEQHSVTRKLISKASQRMALLFLPPISPKPAAACTSVSLRDNIESSTNASVAKDVSDQNHFGSVAEDVCVDQADDIELSAEVEAFDTIVRWSAAKGIARIAERLPLALAQEIVGAVASILHEETLEDEKGRVDVSMTSEYSWHGALMSIAELSRRGLLPPQMLRETIPWIVRGLTYEIQRGNYSVGSNVRDAACYVMWSFARINNPLSKAVFAELSTHMATALVSVATFDREPNVRRAASAAYQEHVGRHSLFPHGIAVLQLADFFSVGTMRNAFIVASQGIAE